MIPAITLEAITVAFDALNADQQIMLLDYLADRTPYTDELFGGLWEAAKEHGRFVAEDEYPGADDQEDIADDIACRIIAPASSSKEYRARQTADRNGTLNFALDFNLRRRAAA